MAGSEQETNISRFDLADYLIVVDLVVERRKASVSELDWTCFTVKRLNLFPVDEELYSEVESTSETRQGDDKVILHREVVDDLDILRKLYSWSQ